MKEVVEVLVAACVDLLRDGIDALEEPCEWDAARIPMHVMDGSRAAGIAYLMKEDQYVAAVWLERKGSFRLTDELCDVLSASTGEEVRRVRINVSPSWETSIDYFGQSSKADGGRQEFGIWPDETRDDNEGPPSRPIRRSFSHDYVATGTDSIAPLSQSMSRFEQWAERNASALLDVLNPPASDTDIAEFEQRHGLTFPKSVRQAYLAHDGQSTAVRDRVFPARTWLPLAEIEKHLSSVGERQGANTAIPVLAIDGGVTWVDSVNSRDDESPLVDFDGSDLVLADSFAAFLEKFVTELESGVYVFWNGLWQVVAELEEIHDE